MVFVVVLSSFGFLIFEIFIKDSACLGLTLYSKIRRKIKKLICLFKFHSSCCKISKKHESSLSLRVDSRLNTFESD